MAHRAYLKEHEGRRYRIGITEDGINSSKWEQDYRDDKYNPEINMIEINPDELVGELDEHSKIDPKKSCSKEERGMWTELAIKKMKDESVKFSRYDHSGKCDHTHLKLNRPTTPEEKVAILRYFFPERSWEFIDTSLCEKNHLIAVPFAKHWRYGTIKKLVDENEGVIINVDDEKFKPYIETKEVEEFEFQKTSGVTADIIRNIKITDLANQFGAQKGKGTDMYHCCFHHPDKNPSLSLNDKKGWFNCFGCDRKGNIVDFYAEGEHISKEEAVKRLIERAGISNNSYHKEKYNELIKVTERVENIDTSVSNKREETLNTLREFIKLDELETDEALEQLHKKTGYKTKVLRKILDGFRASEYNSQKLAKKINSDKIQYDKSELKRIVLTHLLKGEIDHATEILCQEIKDKEEIYTTREDEKSEVWIYQDGIYIPNGKTYIKEFCRLVLEESYTAYLANLVISKLETDTYI